MQARGTVGEYAKPPHKVSPFAVEKASPPASLVGTDYMHPASAAALPQGLSGQHLSGVADSAGLLQWPSSSEALRKAALSLNAQLAQIDKQVLQHVVPQLQRSPSHLQNQDIVQQVRNNTSYCCRCQVF